MPTVPGQARSVVLPGESPRACDSGDWPEGVLVGYFTHQPKMIRICWFIVQSTIDRFSPRRAGNWRAFLLRLFGARVGPPKPRTTATGAPVKSRRERPPFQTYAGNESHADSATPTDGGPSDG